MDQLLRHIKKEWAQLMNAPGAFVTLVVLAFLSAFAVVEWAYSAKISGLEQEVSTVKSDNELLKDRIQSKDDQLTEYRSHNLDLQNKLATPAPAKAPQVNLPRKEQLRHSATRFSDATNKELTSMADKLSDNISGLARAADVDVKGERGTSDYSFQLLLLSRNAINDYQDKYESDAIVLRDEMLARLPLVDRPIGTNDYYQRPVNLLGLNDVAKDLKLLGHKLPPK